MPLSFCSFLTSTPSRRSRRALSRDQKGQARISRTVLVERLRRCQRPPCSNAQRRPGREATGALIQECVQARGSTVFFFWLQYPYVPSLLLGCSLITPLTFFPRFFFFSGIPTCCTFQAAALLRHKWISAARPALMRSSLEASQIRLKDFNAKKKLKSAVNTVKAANTMRSVLGTLKATRSGSSLARTPTEE